MCVQYTGTHRRFYQLYNPQKAKGLALVNCALLTGPSGSKPISRDDTGSYSAALGGTIQDGGQIAKLIIEQSKVNSAGVPDRGPPLSELNALTIAARRRQARLGAGNLRSHRAAERCSAAAWASASS